MPAFAALLAWVARYGLVLLIENIGSLIVKGLLAFNVGFVTYKWVTTPIVGYIMSSLSGAPAKALDALRAVAFDQAVTIILSAYAVRAALDIKLTKKSGSSS